MNRHRNTIAILGGFLLLLVACNLGTGANAPPTLAPLSTRTPPPTLGYVAAGPARARGIGATPAAPSDIEIYRILDQVESDRLMTHIRTLQDFYTRHVNSAQASTNRGTCHLNRSRQTASDDHSSTLSPSFKVQKSGLARFWSALITIASAVRSTPLMSMRPAQTTTDRASRPCWNWRAS